MRGFSAVSRMGTGWRPADSPCASAGRASGPASTISRKADPGLDLGPGPPVPEPTESNTRARATPDATSARMALARIHRIPRSLPATQAPLERLHQVLVFHALPPHSPTQPQDRDTSRCELRRKEISSERLPRPLVVATHPRSVTDNYTQPRIFMPSEAWRRGHSVSHPVRGRGQLRPLGSAARTGDPCRGRTPRAAAVTADRVRTRKRWRRCGWAVPAS